MNPINCKVFISDEGLGPVVRQRAILEALTSLDDSIRFSIQTKKHLDGVKRIIPDAKFVNRYNNISWSKLKDGSPDVITTRKHFSDYMVRSNAFIKKELAEREADFIISDFVYEAFEVGQRKAIPAFGVAHFTWDWFFSKLYPPTLDSNVLDRFFDFAAKAKTIYFPPFTPREILNQYKKNSKQVPLIIRSNINHKKVSKAGKFNVLLVDSGSGVLKHSISKALKKINELSDFHFFVSSVFNSTSKNVSLIDKNELFIDYVDSMDLVIGRAGFNTISECIALRTPMLLLTEEFNPEMHENIVSLKKSGLGSFISLADFENNLNHVLPLFMKNEYKSLKQNMRNHEFKTNGAEVIAKDMLNKIK